jgi:hypothetical protein
VMTDVPELGDRLFAAENRCKDSSYWLHCVIQGRASEMNGSFYTNCGGGSSFSGTGLLNSDDHLALIHRYSTDCKHDAESLETGFPMFRCN